LIRKQKQLLTLMALRKLFINLFPLFLFANTYKVYTDVTLFSNYLDFDIFSKKWDEVPTKKEWNKAFSFSKIGVEVGDDIFYGIKYEADGVVKINRGFFETWYYAQEDFNVLLKKNDINYFINSTDIKGYMNYAQYYAFYIKKRFKDLFISLNFLKGDKLYFINLDGKNTQERFIADLDYIYTHKNFITHQYNNPSFNSYGMSVDIESSFKVKDMFFKIGGYNIFGFLKWKNVNYMHYHFDSNTKYIGEDGFIHYKPFGEGYYKTGYDYFQKLPLFFKYLFEYKKRYYSVGSEGIYSKNIYCNVPYMRIKIKKFCVKLGYVIENSNLLFGFNFKNFSFEISKKFNFHTNFARLLINFEF